MAASIKKASELLGRRLPTGLFLGSQASYLSISPIEFPQDLLRLSLSEYGKLIHDWPHMLFDLKGKSVAEHWDIVADLLNCNISMFRNQKSLAVSWLTHF